MSNWKLCSCLPIILSPVDIRTVRGPQKHLPVTFSSAHFGTSTFAKHEKVLSSFLTTHSSLCLEKHKDFFFFFTLLEIWMVKVVCFHAFLVEAGHWVLTAAWYSVFIPSHPAVNSLLHQRTNYNSHVAIPSGAEGPSHPWLPPALKGSKQPYHPLPCWVWAVACTRTAS